MALVTKNFSDIITFTRASTATFFNSSGVLTSAGNNVPRFDYDPSTLAAQGLLIEEARTNLQVNSENPAGTGWTPTELTVSLNATTAPSGVSNAAKLVPSINNLVHVIEWTATVVASTQYIASVFLKAAGETVAVLWNNVGGAIATFNLSAGTITSGSGTITSVGNGWYRCSISYTPSSINGQIRTYVRQSTAYAGDGISGLYIWGAQLEAGAFPTSYIPTTTTALTRSADVASVNTLSPWYNATEGTVYVEFVWEGLKSVAGQRIVSFDDGTSSNYWSPLSTSANAMQGVVQVGGVPEAVNATPTTTFSAGVLYKQALALEINNSVSAINGTAGTPDTSVTVPTVNTLRLATNPIGETNNIWFRRITYYPRRLSNAELQAITA